ncbi:MAG TPA: hypothetical protein VGZ73_31875 [Bryobacteraceae bacterium]|jgi:hypothetical protein|nr:hypothetical protein [Bryobacteraceae bacterium]
MLVPTEIAKTPQINTAVAEVVKEFSPHVRHIRLRDRTGLDRREWTITFRVLISDKAAKKKNRHDIVTGVRSRMTDLIVPALGVIPDFWFRSESEQKKLDEPAWE